MLETLTVKNIALVHDLELTFSKGFNCLTGETGAGKSILAGALGLIRGNKGELDLLRHGTEEGSVTAVFSLDAVPMGLQWLKDRSLDTNGGQVVIRRVLRRSGKAGIFIQGQPSTLKELTEFSGLLFDMHGQHEHQNLFNVDSHRELLDTYGGLQVELGSFQELFSKAAGLRKRAETLLSNQESRQRRVEDLSYAIEELSKAGLQEGEDEALETEKRLVGNAERIFAAASRARSGLSSDEGGALSPLFTARQALHDLSTMDPSLLGLSQRLDGLYYEIEDLASQVQDYADGKNFDPGRIEEIEERLAYLARLKKKYGPSLGEVLAYQEKAQGELDQLSTSDEDGQRLLAEVKLLEQEIIQRATILSGHRKEAAKRLQTSIEADLKSLGMGKARFEIALSQKNSDRGTPVCGLWGLDAVEFLLSANPGEPLRPIRNAASGGELSRIMLAIKNVLAASDSVPTLIFDEVDSGIGGEVAVSVANHIQLLSQQKQILAITHLASIAVRADNHIKVEKVQDDSRTFTMAGPVRGDARVREIARMLSGDSVGDASIRHAAEMLSRHHGEY